MTKFSLFIQYVTSSERELELYQGKCSSRLPDSLRVDFNLERYRRHENS